MPTTDEELQSLQDKVNKTRDQADAEEAKRLERERALANDLAAIDLQAELARQEARLAEAKRINAAAVKESAAAPFEAARGDQKLAETARDAVTKAADGGTDK